MPKFGHQKSEVRNSAKKKVCLIQWMFPCAHSVGFLCRNNDTEEKENQKVVAWRGGGRFGLLHLLRKPNQYRMLC